MKKLYLVVVPSSIEQWLSVSKQPHSVLTDYSKLSNTLSSRDVAFYLYCQHLAWRAMHPTLMNSFDNPLVEMGGLYDDFTNANRDGWRLVEEYQLQNPKDTIRPLFDGVMEVDSTEGYANYTFELFEINVDTFGVRLKTLETDRSPKEQEIEAVSQALEILNNYNGFESAAKSPLMNRYVALNSSNYYLIPNDTKNCVSEAEAAV